MARSTDYGLNWVAIPSGEGGSTFPASFQIRGIAYGDGTFIAVGDARMARSTDYGQTWIALSVPSYERDAVTGNYITFRLNDIAYGDGVFIAVGGDGKSLYSNDKGESWIVIQRDNWFDPFTQSINSITYGNNRFYAVCGNGSIVTIVDIGSGSLNLRYSITTAGIDSNSTGLTTSINGIAFGDGTFIAVGINGLMTLHGGWDSRGWNSIISGIGESWRSTFTAFQNINNITYGDGTFIAVGSSGRMAFSTNYGVDWTPIPADTGIIGSTFPYTSILGIAYGNRTFIVVGEGGRMARYTIGE
jgi:hypothetical protein